MTYVTTTVGQFSPFQYGKSLPERDRREGNYPVVSSAGIVGFHNEALVNGPGVVIGRKGTVGSVTYISGPFWPIDTAFYVVDDPSKRDIRFTYYLLSSLGLSKMNSDSAVPGLNRDNAESVAITVPDLKEQMEISGILGALDDKIAVNRRLSETLEAIAQALFQSWFVDFDPVRAKASGEAPESICQRLGLTPDLLALFPVRLVESELGEIPDGWEASVLGDVIDIFDNKRVPLSNREREQRKGEFPYYGAASVMDYVDDYLFDGVFILMGEDGSVINLDGTPILQYVWGKFWVNNHAHVIQAKSPISNEQLLLFLQQANIAALVTGAVQAKLNQGNLKRIPFVQAPDAINEEFGKLVASEFGSIRSLSEECRILEKVRTTLLPKLLAGSMRIPAEARHELD